MAAKETRSIWLNIFGASCNKIVRLGKHAGSREKKKKKGESAANLVSTESIRKDGTLICSPA